MTEHDSMKNNTSELRNEDANESLPRTDLERTQRTDDVESGGSVVVKNKTCRTFVLHGTIKDYLEDLDGDELNKYLLMDKVLVRYGRLMDIVTSSDERTMCFTKG